MQIHEETYKWAYALTHRAVTKYLILHHVAGSGFTAQQLHQYHLGKGWSGIAYHYYVRKDGSVYRGRPENKVGGHTSGMNSVSIGICFEGNFETEQMSAAQLESGLELVRDIRSRYPNIIISGHREHGATACPGKNFPLDKFKEDYMTGKEIAAELEKYYASLPVPDWAKAELQEAIDMGITDGSNPTQMIPRYQAAIMCKRAVKGGEQ